VCLFFQRLKKPDALLRFLGPREHSHLDRLCTIIAESVKNGIEIRTSW
jgi:hypothetical protein